MELHITSHEAVSGIADLIKRVREKGDAFIVEEGGRGICAITPINGDNSMTLAGFADLLRTIPVVDEEYLAAVEEHTNCNNNPMAPESRWES